MEKYMAILKLLEEFKMIDETGHILDCGYTEVKPVCRCESFGNQLHSIVA